MRNPDFNEWLKTPEGISCNDYNSLTGEEYLKNRLFWAFDAGRNCVWEQYLNLKKENQHQYERIAHLEEALKNSLNLLEQTLAYRKHVGLNAGNVFLVSAIEKAKSILK